MLFNTAIMCHITSFSPGRLAGMFVFPAMSQFIRLIKAIEPFRFGENFLFFWLYKLINNIVFSKG